MAVKKLLNPKIILILLLIAAISAGGFWGFKIYKNKNNENNYFITESGQKIPKKIDNPDLDSDADGLRDWEEPLYGTDPRNSDTDNDGYLDGEEVMSGYDPTRPAPDDKKSDLAMEPRLKPQTLTDNLTENLFFMILEKRINPQDAEKILFSPDLEQSQTYAAVGTAFEQLKTANQKLYNLPEIADSIINITNDNSAKALEAYNQKDKKIAEGITEKNLTIDRVIEAFSVAIETKDFSTTSKIRDAFKDIYNELITMSVPSSLASEHKLKIQFFSAMIQILSDIEDIQSDPVKVAISVEKFQNLTTLLVKIYEEKTGEKIINDEQTSVWDEENNY